MNTTVESTTRQPRERAVPCRCCRRDTWDLWAICERCTDRAVAMGIHPAGSAS